jgi:hypothetical protein
MQIKISSNNGRRGVSGGATYLHLFILKKKIFSRNSRLISIKLGTIYPWVKGIQNCTGRGQGPLQRGDNHKNSKTWKCH